MDGGEDVSLDRIRGVAALTRVALSSAEAARVAAEFSALRRDLDLPPPDGGPAGAEEATGADGAAPLRPDRIAFDPLSHPVGEVAPDWEEGFFVVPRLPTAG